MPRIFISYRRADSKTVTGRIYDRLRQEFGRGDVFKDVDDIPPGTDFRSVLKDAITTCDVMLVIVGSQWLNITDDQNQRRLDNPEDFVRIEVEMGLQRDTMQVIPVLVEGAAHPGEVSLPEPLKPLAYKNSVVVRDDPDFHRDMNVLIRHLGRSAGIHAKRRRDAILALALLAVVATLVLLWLSSRAPGSFSPSSALSANTTQTSRGETLFSENFDDSQRDWDLDWHTYGQARISQGHILLTSYRNAFIAELLPDFRRQDFYIEATVTPLTENYVRIGFGVGSDEDNQLHLFMMGEDDAWEIRYFDYDGQREGEDEQLVTVFESPAIQPLWASGDSVRVGLQAMGSNYTLYRDDQPLETLQVTAYGDQIFLVVQATANDTVQAYFDDVNIWGVET